MSEAAVHVERRTAESPVFGTRRDGRSRFQRPRSAKADDPRARDVCWIFALRRKASAHRTAPRLNLLPSRLVHRCLTGGSVYFLDCVGKLASLANRVLLKREQPRVAQIAAWDRYMISISRVLDPLTGRPWDARCRLAPRRWASAVSTEAIRLRRAASVA